MSANLPIAKSGNNVSRGRLDISCQQTDGARGSHTLMANRWEFFAIILNAPTNGMRPRCVCFYVCFEK